MRTLPHLRLFLGKVKKKKAENEDGTATLGSMQKDPGSNKEKWFRDKKKRFRDEKRRACATTRVS
jgi:hypothetical protein